MRLRPKKLATITLITASLALAPAVTAPITGLDGDAAHAKPGNGKGHGKGASNGNRGGHSASKGNSGKGGKNHSKSRDFARSSNDGAHQGKDREARPLHPSEKGRWNASNANQRALDAHIRNQNFNGTIGALSQYQLAAKAADGESLNRYERAALDGFVDTSTPEVPDRAVSRFLNQNSDQTGYVFSVDNGVVECKSGCPTDPNELDALERRAQNAADGFVSDKEDAISQKRLDAFLAQSERRIVNDSNKDLTPERNQDLLDELADDLGVVRQDFSDGMRNAGRQIKEDFGKAGEDFRKASRDIGKAFRGLFETKN